MSIAPLAAASAIRVSRVEVHPAAGQPDPAAEAVLADARAAFGADVSLKSSLVYLIEAPLTDQQLEQVAGELLADVISQRAVTGHTPAADGGAVIEVHYQPGVMDPVAQSAQDALVEAMAGLPAESVSVRTGRRYDVLGAQPGPEALRAFAQAKLANPVIQDIYLEPLHPESFPHGTPHDFRLIHVPIRDLDTEALRKLSRDGHLFLSLEEMQAIQAYYQAAEREPTDIELETFAQTWSEHCVHKTLKSAVRYVEDPRSATPQLFADALDDRPGHRRDPDGSIRIDNLLKHTIAAATFKLMEDPQYKAWCVSVFVDNAGIVRFDDEDAVCIKVETHNHPSAIEPYGGAATGIGGCIRDVMGTGLAARPIANTNVFAVAFAPDLPQRDGEAVIPKGVIHPRRILQQVVAGVRDYGNRMGIPTVNGAVAFHPGYLANPLVFAGCIGLIPLDKCFGDARPGDHIIAMGGRTGRDGIHGATFSSAELTDTHADEFAHAVQIGNAITQKKMLDVILQARDAEGGPLFTAITDCGAGGFSSAVGEMGAKVGATVQLDAAPLKYQGLSYTEIWISEAQERMVLAVPAEHVARLAQLCDAENVELCDLGTFGTTGEDGTPELVLNYQGQEVGRLSMELLHEGIPTPVREARWGAAAASGAVPAAREGAAPPAQDVTALLPALLAHPNIASKHWIIRQYDHEVQGGSAVKPLVGVEQDGPSDGAVVRPKLSSSRGVAIACGMAPWLADSRLAADADPYTMALAGIDEAVRNIICVGADPERIAILDNFCWPSCGDADKMAALVRAAVACYDGALAYRTPFVSGKDSLNNQFTTDDGRIIAIPPTLLITAMSIVPDVTRCRTMDAKAAGNMLVLVGATTETLGGSHLVQLGVCKGPAQRIPRVDLALGPKAAAAVAQAIAAGYVASAHDCSDGGLLVAVAEMAIAGRLGVTVDLERVPPGSAEASGGPGGLSDLAACFAETPSRYLLEVTPGALEDATRTLASAGVPFAAIGRFEQGEHMQVTRGDRTLGQWTIGELHRAWRGTLDW